MSSCCYPLSSPRIESACAKHQFIGTRVLIVDEIASTNDYCHDAAAAGEWPGLVVFAEHQTSGRGQRGSQWSAPSRSSLLFSLMIHPPAELAAPNFLIAWAATAVSLTIREMFPLDARIKWPNDLLIDGRKVAGILVEKRVLTVVGIGLNVFLNADDFPANPRLTPTSLMLETEEPIDRTDLACKLLARLETLYASTLRTGPDHIYDAWSNCALPLVDREVLLTTRTGTAMGRLLSLRPDFGARLELPDGSQCSIAPEELIRIERSS